MAAARHKDIAKIVAGDVKYLTGFGNGFETEALPGALPIGRNSPQSCAYGLYAEQLSGSPFTAPRAINERSWLYRIRPTVDALGPVREDRRRPVAHRAVQRGRACRRRRCAGARCRSRPRRSRSCEGVRTITTAGDAGRQAGMAAHLYLVTRSMVDDYFYNADGEMMFVPQQGRLRLWTEFGIIDIEPGEIAVIPRGVKLRVELQGSGPARGYLCENYGGAFTLPERGPIGANCLANPRDFLTPVAAYEDRETPRRMTVKWGGTLWRTRDRPVAARRGRLARQLRALQVRPAPLLAGRAGPVRPRRPVDLHGADLAVRDAGHRQHRLRRLPRSLDGRREHLPPALVPHERDERVHGADLRPVRRQAARLRAGRLLPAQLHAAARAGCGGLRQARATAELKPHKLESTMAFMFETRLPQRVTRYAVELAELQKDYVDCWSGIARNFDPKKPDWNPGKG